MINLTFHFANLQLQAKWALCQHIWLPWYYQDQPGQSSGQLKTRLSTTPCGWKNPSVRILCSFFICFYELLKNWKNFPVSVPAFVFEQHNVLSKLHYRLSHFHFVLHKWNDCSIWINIKSNFIKASSVTVVKFFFVSALLSVLFHYPKCWDREHTYQHRQLGVI